MTADISVFFTVLSILRVTQLLTDCYMSLMASSGRLVTYSSNDSTEISGCPTSTSLDRDRFYGMVLASLYTACKRLAPTGLVFRCHTSHTTVDRQIQNVLGGSQKHILSSLMLTPLNMVSA